MATPYRRVGRIQKPHGTKGEVVVVPDGGLSFVDIRGLQVWVVPPPLHATPYRVTDARSGPKGVVLTLEGIDEAAAAHELVGRWLLAASDDLPAAPEEAPDVLGYAVVDAARGNLGVITDVIVTGANDVFVVDEGPFGQVLLPVIADVVREIDHDARAVSVTLLDGLLDEE
mgnify:CR=1 FL=1